MGGISVLAAFILAIASVSSERYPNVNTEVLTSNDAKDFTALLKNLIRVNEGRMKNLKWMSKSLQKPAYQLDKILRTGMNEDRPRNRPDVAAFFVLPKRRLRSAAVVEPYQTKVENRKDERKKATNKQSKQTTKVKVNDKITVKDDANLRASLRSCKSRSVKKCKRACQEAVSSACSTYSCKRKLKRTLKKECKKSCKRSYRKDYFNSVSDSSGGW